MNVHRKSLMVQIILFIVFFIIGANIIVNYYLGESVPWIGYVVIALLVGFGVLGFRIYRKPDTRIAVVTQKEMNVIRYLLYGYFGVYILHFILSAMDTINLEIFSIAIGSTLMVIALIGIYLQYRIIKIK